MEENFVREKGKIAASIMCSGFDQVMDYVHEFELVNFWMSMESVGDIICNGHGPADMSQEVK